MEIKKTLEKISPLFQSALVVLLASFFVMTIVYASTTIGNNISTEGNATIPALNATTTNVGTLTVYTGSTLNGLTVTVDSRPTMLNATTTNVGTLTVYTGSTLNGLTVITDSRPTMLNASTTNVGSLVDYGAATIIGNLTARGGQYNFTTTTATTTLGAFVFGNTGTATSTLGVGSSTQKGCIELSDKAGTIHRIIVDEVSGALNVAVGRCN